MLHTSSWSQLRAEGLIINYRVNNLFTVLYDVTLPQPKMQQVPVFLSVVLTSQITTFGVTFIKFLPSVGFYRHKLSLYRPTTSAAAEI